ncbi:MAG: hypothetical protein AAGI92_09245 [Pseudomonadota bacterium]
MRHRIKTIFAGIFCTLSIASAAKADDFGAQKIVFATDLMGSVAMQQLLAITFQPEAIVALNSFRIDSRTGKVHVIEQMIKHEYEPPSDMRIYRTNAFVGPERPFNPLSTSARVVYTNYLHQEEPIEDFDRLKLEG